MAIITDNNKVKFLGTVIDIKTDEKGTRYVDLTDTGALAKFGHDMKLGKWDSFCRIVRDLFRSLCCCCGGDEDDLSYLVDLAEKARAKLVQAPATNREISLVQTEKGIVLRIGNRADALPPAALPERAAEVAPKPNQRALQNIRLQHDHGNTKFTVELLQNANTEERYFNITHKTYYPIIQNKTKGSFKVPVSECFSGTTERRPGSAPVDYAALLCKEMGVNWKAKPSANPPLADGRPA